MCKSFRRVRTVIICVDYVSRLDLQNYKTKATKFKLTYKHENQVWKFKSMKRFRKTRNCQKTMYVYKCFCVVKTSFLIDVLDEKHQRFF
jgi:hypothetical protein